MTRIYGSVTLRPTRIGFLVKPNDRASISRIMRWSTCLWGGRFNPIIPVGRYPKHWRSKHKYFQQTDRETARNYMSFFEPDVLVEAEPGLAASIGYGELYEGSEERQLRTLDELHISDGDSLPELRFGLPVIDAYADLYEKRHQFVMRDEPPALLFNETKLSPIAESIFGAFPKEADADYFLKNYQNVYKPETTDPTVEAWLSVFRDRSTFPFAPTFHEIETTSTGGGEPSFFIFDHTKPTDLIEYWNIRQFRTPVYPVPICWLGDLADFITDLINRNHRPIPNNSFGTKFVSYVLFGRSLNEEIVSELTRKYLGDCLEGSYFRAGIDHPKVATSRHGPRLKRHTIETETKDFEAILDDETISFDSLAPEFAERYSFNNFRWANVVNLSSYESDALALSYPSNLDCRKTPRLTQSLSERPIISREGWVFGQNFKSSKEYLRLSKGAPAIAEWLGQKGISAETSSAGRIANQVIEAVGGLMRTYMFADEETLRLLNNMATQETVLGAVDKETRRQFEGRTIEAQRWQQLLNKRSKNSFPKLSLEKFTERGILSLGLGVDCPHCEHKNWYGLNELDYEIVCTRCLKSYPYPQWDTKPRWKFRVTGPFSVPNFAEGSYSVALTLNIFAGKLSSGRDSGMTFATGMNLKTPKFNREVDFAFWYGGQSRFGQHKEIRFVVGEAKSFAAEAFTKNDIDGLKEIAKHLPGTVLVVATMKRNLSRKEKILLEQFVRWGWKYVEGKMRAPVIILTGTELFADHYVKSAWEKKGEPHSLFARYETFADLDSIAYATQRIYLGLDYRAEQEALWAKKAK